MENKYSFESFIMKCCAAKEWDFRAFARKLLARNGFTIVEDAYRSSRGGKYDSVHNMLAIRGNPQVCLVAHTDVCRDHMFDSDNAPDVKPELKIVEIKDDIREIIQDDGPNFQVGGDDRLGCAINLNIAMNTGYPLALLFTTDEEIGLVSAEYVKFPELLDFEILLQVDRGNHSNQLVTRIGSTRLCNEQTSDRLLKVSRDIGLPRYPVDGMMTDVLAIKNNKMCKNAVNMTCGYHNSWGSNKNEYIDVQEAKDTMRFVASVIKDYYLEGDIDRSDNDTQYEIEFSEEEMSEIERLYGPMPQVITVPRPAGRKSKRRYVENDLFSESSYAKDRRSSSDENADWDSWHDSAPNFDY